MAHNHTPDDPSPPPTLPPSFADILETSNNSDPPPPYPAQPARPRSQRSRRSGRRGDGINGFTLSSGHSSVSGTATGRERGDDDDGGRIPSQDDYYYGDNGDGNEDGGGEGLVGEDYGVEGRRRASETTPLLSPFVPQHGQGYSPVNGRRHGGRRSRSHSYTSTLSAAPSLAHTVLSLFQTDDTLDYAEGGGAGIGPSLRRADCATPGGQQPEPLGFKARWRRYFRPMGRRVYYKSFFHLLLINFPYALLAWVYLFVFTVTGTTLLVALPLGAVLCFFNLLGARALAAGELKLQTKFHAPLGHPLPFPPRPIFVRQRPIAPSEVEASADPTCSGYMVPERSFYKNTYAMFTDSTSYQALFYFLVVKPAITLLVTIFLWGLGLPLFILILPAPCILRAARRIGIWQANVAIEGLYLAVR